MKINTFIFLTAAALILTGCSVTSHPDYQKTYFKQSIASDKLEEIKRAFKNEGLVGADLVTDNLGRAQLSGTYENEREVEKALSILTSQLSEDQVSKVRPAKINTLDWEVAASKEFAKFIESLAKKYSMSVDVQVVGVEKQVSVNEVGLGGVEQFPSGSAEPSPKAVAFYQQMVKQLVETSGKKISQKKFLVVGHTDDVGDTEKNAQLSERRARNIGRILEAGGISAANIYFQGAGETLPIADNKTESGRARNRRVEFTELANEANLSNYIQNRQPNVNFYRYKPPQKSEQAVPEKKQEPSIASTAAEPKLPNIKKQVIPTPDNTASSESTPLAPKYVSKINFGGVRFSTEVATLDVGGLKQPKQLFSLFSSALANSSAVMGDCTADRPRIAGEVKSLETNGVTVHKTSEYAPGLNGKTWASLVNSNLVVINRVSILRENGEVTNPPLLNIYANYTNSNPNTKPDLSPPNTANAYLVGKGILFRIFPTQASGISCVDVLFPTNGSTEARAGKIVYNTDKALYVADYKPNMLN